ncbi:MAG: uroporphyrinogen-III synthase [Candidatus Aquicultorales bacterium]
MSKGQPLRDKRVLVTRAGAQAKALSGAISELGGIPVEIPLIKTVPPRSYEALDRAIDRLPAGYDWLVFTSANAVRFFAERLEALGKGPEAIQGLKVASIGPVTSRVAKKHGLTPTYQPEEAVAESVVEGFKGLGVEGERFLIPRAEVARDVIPEGLRSMGAIVDVVDAYRTIPNEESGRELRRLIAEEEIDVLTFTSSSTVKNFVALLHEEHLKAVERLTVAVIGPVTAKTAQELGIHVDVIPDEYTVDGMVKALAST